MADMRTILRLIFVTGVFAFVCGTANGQQLNPNRLLLCPKDQTAHYHNCWGIYVSDDGAKYVGEFKDNKYHGKGTYAFASGDNFDGSYKDGKRNGQGTYNHMSGDKYTGEFRDGKEHGQGTYTWANGDRYVGEFKYGKTNGIGTYYFLATNQFKGDKYFGEFKDGNANGLGTYTFSDGMTHFGEFKNDMAHGQGIRTSVDGTRIEGIWEKNQFVRESKVNLQNINSNLATNTARTNSDRDSDLAIKQQANPNNLRPCPKPDYSKSHDVGLGGRTEKWSNCWGRYRVEFSKDHKGDVFEGEWLNGLLHGLGTYYYQANNQFKGDKYFGENINGKMHGQGTYTHSNGNKYVGKHKDGMRHGQGTFSFSNGDKYVGEFKENKRHGLGSFFYADGTKFYGEYKNDFANGRGIATFNDGRRQEGIWENNNFIREAKVNLPAPNANIAANTDRADLDRERQQLAEERRRLEEDKQQREQQKRSQRLNLTVSNTQPGADGGFTINIQTNADTASLLINGEEEGGRVNGDYIVKKVARAGQDTKVTIVATDINGNTDTKSITVSRQVIESKAIYAALNPTKVKRQPERDAVAVVIGIADYRSLPKAEYANDDARAFYDYAIRALGVKPENIKLLIDSDAEEAEILKTIRTWLPSRVRSSTDVYVYYSGHGSPAADGQGFYILPQRTDRDLVEDTAIPISKINSALQLAKPRSVTIFMDACYSGQARSGETLVASARPISLRTENRFFPDGFTVITASQHDQISSSSPDLQHGIFSYYLMRGMEGDADANKDGKITLGEMQAYLSENVDRQAAMISRKQEPQLIGDANRVLVGR